MAAPMQVHLSYYSVSCDYVFFRKRVARAVWSDSLFGGTRAICLAIHLHTDLAIMLIYNSSREAAGTVSYMTRLYL